ncbi:lipid A export ATP-binding/permease protein MsbA [Rhizobium tropici CIAT 899]|uniref:ABC transporter ATP-binding protein n=2 Tax=Rhizobium tropici TaxID=398 RepID=A0A6P1C8M8_RHITR|nr:MULTISPECIES: ABC transporter ATP-binding protein [Rhizobium]AGB69637.1 lipid A export ATP-binding/permease protein MsbA [Rhizobium tropici CIAT 899]MBB4244019.1 ATP-binding cassette subfamily B protein [Rhizobium tropici]MBB5595144.1 ATP-binding cassette subfamily B protein [Rhizobium tropici]MBB6494358.1 ATP-binding cassette subfamily B protein [Rhizobium tropici]NEV12502.1 ABC transporter ATP-binding protein [Rhizobium tropici]
MKLPDPKSKNVDSEAITGMLKRIIAENGRDHIRGYSIAITCLIFVALSTAYIGYIVKSVIDSAFIARDIVDAWKICFSIFLVFVVRGFAGYFQSVILSKIGNNIIARYQRRLYSHLMTLSVGFFSEARSAQLAARVSQNVSGIRDVMNLTITSTARDLLTFIALLCVMVFQDPVLSIAFVVIAPPLFFALRYISKRLRAATRDAIVLNSHVLGAMQETIQGVSIVKAFTMEEELERKINKLITAAEHRQNRIARLSERNGPLIETVAGFAIASLFAYAAYRSIYDNVSPGVFFSFATSLLLAYDPARRLAKLQVQLERAVVNARMIYELLDMEPRQRDLPDAKPLVVTEARIEFRDVHFAYGDDAVLSGVNFTAEGGQTTALVGPSGAGKSTVINLIPRFYDPKAGSIFIDGQDIAHVTKQSLREQLAYVSQQPYLFEGTIRDNIRYGRPEATDAEIKEAARLAYAHDFIEAQPMGYDTPVGENGVTLSGGQRQRLSIARALVRNAPILLLDEATSALDTESEAAVQKALEEAMSGRTVVVIAHRLSTVVRAEKIVVMQNGRVVEEGNHETLATSDNGLYARLNNLQLPAISSNSRK